MQIYVQSDKVSVCVPWYKSQLTQHEVKDLLAVSQTQTCYHITERYKADSYVMSRMVMSTNSDITTLTVAAMPLEGYPRDCNCLFILKETTMSLEIKLSPL